ncbi:hypothetical protein ES705_31480 [subsurface metagenome]
MKKLIYLSLLVLLCIGCKTITKIPGYDLLLGLDFRPYAEKGFLITPHTYTAGEYTTISLVDYKIMPDAELKEGQSTGISAGYQDATVKVWSVDEIEPQDALDKIFEICIDMGADALIDFTIEEATDEHLKIKNPVTIEGIRITGLAIRRED